MGNFNDYSQCFDLLPYSKEVCQEDFLNFKLEYELLIAQFIQAQIAMDERSSLLKRKCGSSCQRLIEPIDEVDDKSHSMMDLTKIDDRKRSDYCKFRKQLRQLLSNEKIEGKLHECIAILQELQCYHCTLKKSTRCVKPNIEYMEID